MWAIVELDPNVIIPAVITGFGGIIAAVFAYLGNKNAKRGAKHAAAANDAVNNVHSGAPKLYDLALDNQAKIRKTHRQLDDFQASNDLAHEDINDRIDTIGSAVRSHVEWEEGEEGKYATLEERFAKVQKTVKQWESDNGVTGTDTADP
ncbi:MAG: hypothetical protein KJN71_03420 [Acidimicrobiia bacterium]|nr:hypothetical protein [Acidimicrobiia bacterium]